MNTDLIFDIGLHRGEDTEFYLGKGFRVVGVEANPALCAEVAERFSHQVASGQLTIVNKAIAERSGAIKFFVNSKFSVWGTVNREWAERNSRLGADSTEVEVEATTMGTLLETFGCPYYVKIDIEGNDLLVLEGLRSSTEKPEYVSIESDKDSFRALRKEISTLAELGYSRFNIVNQHHIIHQESPQQAREGRCFPHKFKDGSSGLFGKELPGRWISADQAIEAYRPVFLRYALTGDDPFVRNKWLRLALRAVRFNASWYDTHAKRM